MFLSSLPSKLNASSRAEELDHHHSCENSLLMWEGKHTFRENMQFPCRKIAVCHKPKSWPSPSKTPTSRLQKCAWPSATAQPYHSYPAPCPAPRDSQPCVHGAKSSIAASRRSTEHRQHLRPGRSLKRDEVSGVSVMTP